MIYQRKWKKDSDSNDNDSNSITNLNVDSQKRDNVYNYSSSIVEEKTNLGNIFKNSLLVRKSFKS